MSGGSSRRIKNWIFFHGPDPKRSKITEVVFVRPPHAQLYRKRIVFGQKANISSRSLHGGEQVLAWQYRGLPHRNVIAFASSCVVSRWACTVLSGSTPHTLAHPFSIAGVRGFRVRRRIFRIPVETKIVLFRRNRNVQRFSKTDKIERLSLAELGIAVAVECGGKYNNKRNKNERW